MRKKTIKSNMQATKSRLRAFTPRLPIGSLTTIFEILRENRGEVLIEGLRNRAAIARASKDEWKNEEEAICLVLADLAGYGWEFRLVRNSIYLIPRNTETDEQNVAKRRIRESLLATRDLQLSEPSVNAFLVRMHQPRQWKKHTVSIEMLIDNGNDLALMLKKHRNGDLSKVCQPYLQLADAAERCEHTNLNLMDIWRYFRHTWSLEYRATPGRTLCFLIRNAARPFHPVIGIIGLANAVFQLRDRDNWIGWTPASVLQRISLDPEYWSVYREAALDCLKRNREQIRSDDLFKEIGRTKDIRRIIERLELIAHSAATDRTKKLQEHYEQNGDGKVGETKAIPRKKDGSFDWLKASESLLFRRKRAEVLSEIIFAEDFLSRFPEEPAALLSRVELDEGPRGITPKWKDTDFGKAFHIAVREMKKNGVATRIMDVNVCGATPIYREILGGKLAALSLFSREIQDNYSRRYSDRPSEISSSMAGKAITKQATISLLTTTSLYGAGSSQYNRVRMAYGNTLLQWQMIGRTEGYGTLQFSRATIEALRKVAMKKAGMRNVNYIFGEGTSPLMRQLRDGLQALHFEPNSVLQHGQARIVYALELYPDAKKDLALDRSRNIVSPSMERIAKEWIQRWLSMRAQNDEVLGRLALCNVTTVRDDLKISENTIHFSSLIGEP